MQRVITKSANVDSFKRPSVKAIKATTYSNPGSEITVYPSVEGWLEIRKVDKKGLVYAEFIQRKDVKYKLGSYIRVGPMKFLRAVKRRVKRVVSAG